MGWRVTDKLILIEVGSGPPLQFVPQRLCVFPNESGDVANDFGFDSPET